MNTENNTQMTAEEYRLMVLKKRFAERTVELEEQIATLYTKLAQAEQEIESMKSVHQEDTNVEVQEEGPSSADAADRPD